MVAPNNKRKKGEKNYAELDKRPSSNPNTLRARKVRARANVARASTHSRAYEQAHGPMGSTGKRRSVPPPRKGRK